MDLLMIAEAVTGLLGYTVVELVQIQVTRYEIQHNVRHSSGRSALLYLGMGSPVRFGLPVANQDFTRAHQVILGKLSWDGDNSSYFRKIKKCTGLS